MLSKEKTEQIRKDAEEIRAKDEYNHGRQDGYIEGATDQATKAEDVLVKALEEIQDCDFGEHIEIATAALEEWKK